MSYDEFIQVMRFAPQQDDLERTNCEHAGRLFHAYCGVCAECKRPRFACLDAGHRRRKS